MKGFQKQSDVKPKKLFMVKHGGICHMTTEPAVGHVPIDVPDENDNMTTKYIEYYAGLEAMVTDITFRDTESKYANRYQSIHVRLETETAEGVLEIPLNTVAGGRFMKLAENLDWTQPVEFRAFNGKKEPGKKPPLVLYCLQNEVKVPLKYTVDKQGDCPPGVPDPVTGKVSFSYQTAWLKNRMETVIIPELRAIVSARTGKTVGGQSDAYEDYADDETPAPGEFAGAVADDDIPF